VTTSPTLFPATGQWDLTDVRLAFLRRELEQLRTVRREQEADLQERIVDDGDPVAQAHVLHVRDLLGSIQAALDRMDDGRYGRCVHCSAPIPFERLELLPHADGCVACLSRIAPWR
jgi:RNA polymerase-binding transcription factor DksA